MEILNRKSWLRKPSLSKQLLLSFGIPLMTVGVATLGVNYRLIQSDLSYQVKARAQSITQSLEFATEGVLEREDRNILRRVVQNFATMPAVLEIAILSPDGKAVAHSSLSLKETDYKKLHPELQSVMGTASTSGTEASVEVMIDGKPALAQIMPFSSALFGSSGRRGLAIAIVDLKQIEQEAGRTFLASTLTMLAGAAMILLLMALLIHRKVLRPLQSLNDAVLQSKETGSFAMPPAIPENEIRFLADSFDKVIKQLEAHDRLKAEITQRQQVEATLRESEARERKKSQELQQTLVELKQAQVQLVQSEKMSSLGQLVAGVAHEINNPVNFIHGNILYANQYAQELLELLELYQRHYPTPIPAIQMRTDEIDLDFLRDDLPKLLSSMQLGADRIKEIIQSLRAFSRLDEAEVKDVNIHDGIDSTLLILQNRLKAKPEHPAIQIIKEYGNLPLVECYAGQLNQVFMNILSNAIDALDERDANRSLDEITQKPSQIKIWTEVIEREGSPGRLQKHIRIHIADNGPGMSESVQKRLFDPFFTTKPVGKGTGMGMSISHQVVTERHQGSLQCISAPEAGTEFVIEIPIRQGRS